MNSDYSHNPLTEVALALSMAFFALMVLTIFALSQKQFKSIESDKISINSKSSIIKDKKRILVFYHNKKFYDQNLKIWRLENQGKQTNKYTLAVPKEMSVKELFEIKKIFQDFDLQVAEQNQQWNNALKNISTKVDKLS